MIRYSKTESYLKYISHYCDAVTFTKSIIRNSQDSSNKEHSLEMEHVSGGLVNKVVLL